VRWFLWYVRYYFARNFHKFHFLKLGQFDNLENYPLIVCLNHPSWWDPLVSLYLSRRFLPNRQHFAPMAATGLAKYGLFERFGFFGIEPGTRAGAAQFLRAGEQVLQQSSGAFWVTAQGAFTDVRRAVVLQQGLGHLATRVPRFAMLPLALEYAFWDDRRPEMFACFGQPILREPAISNSHEEWTRMFAQALESTQNVLSEAVQRRKPELFEPLLSGANGVGGIYHLWQSFKTRLQRRRGERAIGFAE
jgi:1-acyl-sn-glycerol-3-phosphate acyltransferase